MKESKNLTQDERRLLQDFRQLSGKRQGAVLYTVQYMLDHEAAKRKAITEERKDLINRTSHI